MNLCKTFFLSLSDTLAQLAIYALTGGNNPDEVTHNLTGK
jgi:hypothetical protein